MKMAFFELTCYYGNYETDTKIRNAQLVGKCPSGSRYFISKEILLGVLLSRKHKAAHVAYRYIVLTYSGMFIYKVGENHVDVD